MSEEAYMKLVNHEIWSLEDEKRVYEKDVEELTEAIVMCDKKIESITMAKNNYARALSEYKEKLKLTKEKLDVLEKIKFRAEYKR